MDSSDNVSLNGFLIYDNGKSQYFQVDNKASEALLIPWTKTDYKMVFSGADAGSEVKYSFAVDSMLADLEGVWSIDKINSYESNDSEATSYRVSSAKVATVSFLKKNDIDFFTINVSEIIPEEIPIAVRSIDILDFNSTSEKNNGDGKLNSGETIGLLINFENLTYSYRDSIKITLNSSSSYVSFLDNQGDVGSFDPLECRDSAGKYSHHTSLFNLYISPDIPIGTLIPIEVLFEDPSGAKWKDKISLFVEESLGFFPSCISYALGQTSSFEGIHYDNATCFHLDICIQNGGISQLENLSAKIECVPFRILDDYTSYGNINSLYYKSSYGEEQKDPKYISLLNFDLYSDNGFVFFIPWNAQTIGTPFVEFKINFTDGMGNTWADLLSVQIP